MKNRMSKILISKSRGVALVTVLLIMLVMTILTTGVVVISMANYNQSSKTIDHSQVYYVAEAGINYLSGSFVNKVKELKDLPSAAFEAGIDAWITLQNSQTAPSLDGKGTFVVSANRNGNILTFTSTGTIDSVSRTLVKTISGFQLDKAILTSGLLNTIKINVSGAPVQTLSGPVSINNGSGSYDALYIPSSYYDTFMQSATCASPAPGYCLGSEGSYPVYPDDSLTVLPPVKLPLTPVTTTKLSQFRSPSKGSTTRVVTATGAIVLSSTTVGPTDTYNISTLNSGEEFYAPSISINGSFTGFKINVENKNIKIRTDSLTLKGDFSIIGDGSLTIFVPSTSTSFSTKNSCLNKTCGVKGNPINRVVDNFTVVVTGTSKALDLSMNGNGSYYMSLITETNVKMVLGGTATYNGFFVNSGTSPVDLGGTTKSYALIYTPNADVKVSGTGGYEGAIVGKTFNSNTSNATTVDYNSLFANATNLDFLSPFKNSTFSSTIEQ